MKREEEPFASTALASDREDSGNVHCAGSASDDKLNGFCMNVRKMYTEIWEENSEQTEREVKLIDYMNGMLKERVFTALEQSSFVWMMEELAEILYAKDASAMTGKRYEGLCLRLMEIGEFESAGKWCLRFAEQFPEEPSTYACRLRLYFLLKDRDAFLETLNALKESDVVIDSEIQKMIRSFS